MAFSVIYNSNIDLMITFYVQLLHAHARTHAGRHPDICTTYSYTHMSAHVQAHTHILIMPLLFRGTFVGIILDKCFTAVNLHLYNVIFFMASCGYFIPFVHEIYELFL